MRIISKLYLVALGFLVPLILLIYLLNLEKNKSIEFTVKELEGTAILAPLKNSLTNFQLYCLSEKFDAPGLNRDSLKIHFEKNIEKLQNISEGNIFSSAPLKDLPLYINLWKNLGENSRKDCAVIETGLKHSFTTIGNEFNLVLDPALESYYLMDLIINKFPALEQELLELLSGYPEEEREKKYYLIEKNIRVTESLIDLNLSGTPEVRDTISKKFAGLKKQVSVLGKISVIDSPDIFRRQALTAMTESGEIWQITLENFRLLLRKRIDNSSYDKLYTFLIAGALILIPVVLFFYISGYISRSVRLFNRVAEQVIAGELDLELVNKNKDEFGALSKNLNRMIKAIGTNIAEHVEKLQITENALNAEIIKHIEIEEALSKSELLFSRVWDISVDGMRLTDKTGKIVTVNKAFCEKVGKEKEELEGEHFSIIYHPSVREEFTRLYERDLSGNKIRPHFDRESYLWNGKKIWFAFSNSLLKLSDGSSLVLSVLKDISDRKKSEFELQIYAGQLRKLASHLQSVREEERRMIAREIHDELGQVLTVLKIQITLLANKLREDQQDLKEKIESVSEVIDKTVESVQRISSKLRPGILDELGLIPAIEWYAQDFENRTGIICESTLPNEEIILAHDKITAVFRIFQEALTNVARHAKATKIQITLNITDNIISLRITDNGRGITNKEINAHNSLGLLGMKERAVILDGDVSITGTAGRGTSVCVKLPLENNWQETI